MQNDAARRPEHEPAGAVRSTSLTRARDLERAGAVLRRELSSLCGEYLELGLRASLLAAERDTALQKLRYTEAYLATLRPGCQPAAAPPVESGPPGAGTTTAPPGAGGEPAGRSAASSSAPGHPRKLRWRGAFEAIRQRAAPARRLASDLAALSRELADMRRDYAVLEVRADSLARQRNAVIARLQRASDSCPEFQSVSTTDRAVDSGQEDASLADLQARLQQAQDKLKRLQVERNDLTIALAERDSGLGALQSEQQQSRLDIERLSERLAGTQQELADSRDASETLVARLASLDRASAQARALARQQTTEQQQRIAALEESLQDARLGRQALEVGIDATNRRQAALDQQRQQLGKELEELRTRLAARELQLVQLQAHKEQLRVEFAALGQRLAEAEKDRARISDERQSLTEQLETVRADHAYVRQTDQEQVENPERSLSEVTSRLERADTRPRLPEPRLPKEGEPPEPQQAGPAPAARPAGTAPAGTRRRPVRWTRAAVGLVLLLAALAGGTRLWELYREDGERAGLSRSAPSNGIATPPVEKSSAAGSPGEKDTPQPGLRTQQPAVLADADTGGVAAPAARQQPPQKPAVAVTPGGGSRGGVQVPADLVQADRSTGRSPGLPESATLAATGADDSQADQRPADDGRQREPVGAAPRPFLQHNAASEGVVSLPSGLQYKVLKSGDGSGRIPRASDTVAVRYRGRLSDGREFDNSDKQGGQVSLVIGQLIPSWREALLRMEVGEQWELYVPPALAVPRGTARKRSALGLQPRIYDIELVAIQQPAGAR